MFSKCVLFWSLSSSRIHPSPTAGSVTAASSVSTAQGKPSLRRIKGRIHRSKSLDSIDLMDSNVSPSSNSNTSTPKTDRVVFDDRKKSGETDDSVCVSSQLHFTNLDPKLTSSKKKKEKKRGESFL